jgi:integrase
MFPRSPSVISLTRQTDVFKIQPSGNKETVAFDQGKPSERVAGLALRVRAEGSRRWVFHYRFGGKSQRITIGDASAWSLDKARARARELRVMIDGGINPADTRTAARIEAAKRPTTFGVIASNYLDVAQSKLKPRSHVETTRYLTHYFKPLRDLPISAIERRDVAACLQSIAKNNGAVTADRARSAVGSMFSWAIGEGIAEQNPVAGTNRHADNTPRSRVLSDAEIVKLWNGLPETAFGAVVRLLILTGCRLGEIAKLGWREIDFTERKITLPAERTKNGVEHLVPLSDLALSILDSQHRIMAHPFVFGRSTTGFNGAGKGKERFDLALDKHWTLHDLRRTVRTGLGRLGILPHVSEAVLNHLPPKLVRTYDVNKYESEKRAALDAWAGHIRLILAQAEGANVVTMVRA